MYNVNLLSQIEKLYSEGGNIIQFLKQMDGSMHNTRESILISYDYQAGSYISAYKANINHYLKYITQLVNEIKELGPVNSILEAGVGEATTFKNVIKNIEVPHQNCFGFDISWSRLKIAQSFLSEEKVELSQEGLFVAELASIPLCDNAIDIVYTAHSIEPNGGYEKLILEELFRVTKKYLVLFEPDYGLASVEAKERMESHGYVKNLSDVAKNLGYDVIKHELLPFSLNKLNPTSVIVIEKTKMQDKLVYDESNNLSFQCPITKTELINCEEVFFSSQARLMYPVISGIPCLLSTQAILGCKYKVV